MVFGYLPLSERFLWKQTCGCQCAECRGRAHKTRFLSGVGKALGFQFDVRAVGRHEVGAGRFGRDVADDVHQPQPHHLLLHRQRDREQQFVILPAVQCRYHRVGVHLLGQSCRLTRNRNPLQVDPRPALRRFADLHQVARQPVRQIDHRRRRNLLLRQRLDDVPSRAWFEVLFQQVFIPLELRFGIRNVRENPLFAFEQLEPHVGRPEVARQADQVVLLRTAAACDPLLRGVAQHRDGDHQSGHRSPCVATHEIDLQLLASERNSLVEVLQRFDGNLRRDTQRYGNLRRQGIHGQDVAHTGRDDLVSEVFEREVGEVEIHSLVERIGRAQDRFVRRRGDHRGIVAHPLERRGVLHGEILRQQIDQSEWSERRDLGAFFGLHVLEIFYKFSQTFLIWAKITYFCPIQILKTG